MPQTDITNIRSEEIQQIIGKPPSSIVRRGTTVIACIVVVLLIGSGYLRYPEIISAPVVISATSPPVKLVAQVSGRINTIHFKDGDTVKPDDIVAVIENPAKTTDMLRLKKEVTALDTSLLLQNAIRIINLPKNMQVGELQADYAALFQAIDKYDFFVNNPYYQNKIKSLQQQMVANGRLGDAIKERSLLLGNILLLETIKDSSNKIMRNEKVIAPLEYNEIQKGLLNQRISVTDSKTSLQQNELQKTEYAKSIADIEQQYKTEENGLLLTIKELAKKIRGGIASWERQYLLRSPIEGRLTYFQVWNVNQYTTANTPVFMVVPGSDNSFEIRVKLPQYKAGKVKANQKAHIKLQEYPYEEYGMLLAHVASISTTAMDDSYSVRLVLENGLSSTLHKAIPASPEIAGTADLITENKTLLQRMFEKLYGKIY